MLKALAETKRKEQAENTERTAAPQVSDESVRGPLVSDLNRLTLPALEAERAERAAENRRNALSRPGRDAGVRNAWGERQQTGKAYVGALSRTGGGGNMTENARALSTARRGDGAAEDYRAQTMKAGAKAAVNQRGQMSLAELERYLSSGQFLADTVDYGDAVVTKGMSTASAGLARTADLFLGNAIEGAGKLIGRDWSDNFIRRYAADADAYNRYWTQELQRQAGDSRVKQIGGDLLSAAVAAAPMAIAAYLTGGASLAATGSLQATAAAQGTTVLQGVGQAVSTMLKNPNYWMSFIQEVGNDYYEAREWAPNDDIAAIYGLTVGLVNAGIETGLDGASGIQGLEKSIRQGNTGGLKSFLESIGGEAWEEDMQGLVSRGVGQMFGSGAKTFSMTDENAVINPATMLEEGAMGAGVSAIMGGASMLAHGLLQKGANGAGTAQRNAGRQQTGGTAITPYGGQFNIDNTRAGNYNFSRNGGAGNAQSGANGSFGQGNWHQGSIGAGVSGGSISLGEVDAGRSIGQGNSGVRLVVPLSPESQQTLSQRGVVNVELQDSSADNAAFSAALDAARASDARNGWAVTPKSPAELVENGVRVFMDAAGSTGFGIAADGDIEAVFANKSRGAPKGVAKSTIPQAIANGGTKLDCYGSRLVDLYSQYGFVPVARVEFDPAYANPGWTPENGTPDIYFMMHNGDSADTVVRNYGQYRSWSRAELDALPVMGYDAAYAYRDNLLRQRASVGAQDGLRAQAGNQAAGDTGVPENVRGVQEAFAEILDGNKETASTGEAGDKTLVRRIREAIPQMQGQEAVAKIDGTEIPKQGTIVERLTQFISSIGNKVNRPGFGDVLFSRGKIKSSMLGHGAGNAKIETFAAVPAVIRNGTEIDYQPNWKGRNYDTYTFAAPIEYNGGKTYLGVIVQKDSASKRYYLHEVIDGNGNVLYKNGEAPALTPDGTSALSGDLDTVASAGTNPSDTTVPQEAAGVKGDGSVQEAFAEILDGNKETASTGEAVNEHGLVAYTRQEADKYATGAKNKIITTLKDAVSFVRGALTNRSDIERAFFGKIPNETAWRTLSATGIDVSDYNVMLNSDDARHIMKDHGDSAKEALRGQLPVTAEDIALIPSVVANPDRVYLSADTDGKGRPAIVFEKQIGNKYITVQGVSAGKHVLQTDTLYINKQKNPQNTGRNAADSDPAINVQNVPLQSSSDTTVPQEAAGVKRDGSVRNGRNAPEDGLGAANAGFTRNAGEQVPTQNKTVTQNPFMTDEERARLSPGTHERVSEEESQSRAGNSFYADESGNIVNLHETVDGLLSKELWTGTDQDTAQMAQQELIKEARETGDWDRVAALAAAIEAQGTETGRSLQARKKWAQTGTGIVTEAARALESAKKGTDRGRVLGTVSELAERYDSADAAGDAQALADIIRETSEIRRTGSFFGNRLSRTMEKALGRAVEQNDVEFLKSLASSGIVRIAADYQGTEAADAVRTIRRNAMLSKVSTIMRNLVSNNVFDPLDSVSRNMSVPLDMLLSRYTGTRSVAADRSWFSKAKRQGSMDGMYRAMLEVGLDLDADAGKYETGSGRTFKMAGGLFSRLMSSWEKWMGYALNVTDEFQKGGIRSEVQRGVDELRGKGLVADDSLSDAGQTEALYRTFQDETALSNALLGLRRGLNNLSAGGVGAGDIALPFAQVPANLASRSLEYSPIGLANGLRELGQVLRSAKNSTLTAAQQAKAVQDVGRGLNGTALIAGAAALALGGVLRVADAGGSDDRDRAALEKQSGLSGTQLNVDALLRWANGGDTKWRSGDTLVSIGFLDPLNAQLTTGALIAEDVKSGDADAGSVLGDSLAGTLQAVMDLPVMSVFSDVSNAYRYSGAETEGGRLADAALSYAAGQASSVIPNALKGIAQGTDGYQRDAYTSGSLAGEVLDNIKASIPGLRQTLPAKQDSYGGDMKNGGGLLNFLNTNILPGSVAKYTPSEVTQKLDEIYDVTGNAAVYPDRKAPGTVTAGGEKYELSAEEKRQYQKTRGSVFEETVDAVLRNTGKTSPEELAEMLEEVRQYANEKAKRELLESRGAEYEPSGDAKKLDGADAQTAADYLMMKSAWEDAADRETADAEDYAVLGRMLDAYDNMPQSSKEAIAKISGVEKLLDAAEAGVDPESYFEARDKYTEIYNTDGLKAGEKATRLAEYLNAEFTREEAGKLQELFTYYSMIAGAPDYTAAIDSDYTDAEKLELIKLYDRSDGGDTYRKYAAAYDAGISLKTFDDFRNDTAGMKSEKDANGKDVRGKTKKDKIMAYIDGLELSDGQKDYLYYAAGYKESTIDDAPWH